MTQDEWALIDRYMTGIITAAEFELLQDRLRESAELRAEFRKAASLDIALHDLHCMDPKQSELLAFDFSNAPKPIQGPSHWWTHDVWKMAAAVALLLSLGQFFFQLRVVSTPVVAQVQSAQQTQPTQQATASLAAIATVLKTADCVWVEPKKALAEGAAVAAGELELVSGTLVIAINNGPRIALTGPAKLNLQSEKKAYLDHGYLSFQNFFNSNSFDLTTPKSLLTDVGTEYAVSVNAEGETIHVVGGEVWRTNLKELDDITFIGKGQTSEFGRNQDTAKLLAYVQRNQRLLAAADVRLQKPSANEGFHYSPGASGVEAQYNGGYGWMEPWQLQVRDMDKNPAPAERLKVLNGLHFNDAYGSSGDALAISGDTVMKRKLAQPVYMDADATYYVSLLYKSSDPQGGQQMKLLFKLMDSERPNDLVIGMNQDRQLICRFGGLTKADKTLALDSEILIVAKITAHKTGPDLIAIEAFDSTADLSREPAQWTLRGRTDSSEASWDTVGLHVFSEQPVIIDEVRVSKTWSGLMNK